MPSNQLKARSEFKYEKNNYLSFLMSFSDPTSLDSQRPLGDMEKREQENRGCEQEQSQPQHHPEPWPAGF